MEDQPVRKTIRFPKSIYDGISSISKEDETNFSQVVIEACTEYIHYKSHNICRNCKTEVTDVDFCPHCGYPVSPHAQQVVMNYHSDAVFSHNPKKQRIAENHIKQMIRDQHDETLKIVARIHRETLNEIASLLSSPVPKEQRPGISSPPPSGSDDSEDNAGARK